MRVIYFAAAAVLIAQSASAQSSPEFLYVVQDKAITAFSINPKTGTLKKVVGSPITSKGLASTAASTPDGTLLYVGAQSTKSVCAFRVEPATGALTEVPGSPFGAPAFLSIAVDSTGRFAYLSTGDGQIETFTIDAEVGALTPAGTPVRGGGMLLADPQGPYLFSSGPVTSYGIDPESGAPAMVGGANSSGNFLALNPQVTRIYAGSTASMSVLSFDATSGMLMPIAGSPFRIQEKNAGQFVIDLSDRFLYALEEHKTWELAGYLLDSASGGLVTRLGTWPFTDIPTSLAVEPSGRFIYVSDGSGDLAAYEINRVSGKLMPLTGTPRKVGSIPRQLLVTSPAPTTLPTLISLEITPPGVTINSSATGQKIQFTAVGHYADGVNRFLTASATWSSSNAAFATIENNPAHAGLATTAGSGTATITAQAGGLSATATLTVNSPALTSISVTPVDPSLRTGTAVQFKATGTYNDGSTQNLTKSATWTSSAPAVARMGATGRVVTLTTGSSTIAATVGAVSGSTLLTVQ